MPKDNKTIFETVNNIIKLKADLKRISELRDGAFKALDLESYVYPSLEELLKIRDKFWIPLYDWNSSGNICYSFLELQEWNTINLAFEQVHNAIINRNEFVSILEPSRESVEKYIEELQGALSKEEAYLAKRYDKFVAEEEDDSFTIEATKHKEAVLNKFLQS